MCNDYQKHAALQRKSRGLCKECPNPISENSKSRCEECLAGGREKDKRFKAKVIALYGGKCACPHCNENRLGFLTIDHPNNDGAKHRREGGDKMYRWLRRNGFPDGFRVLCFNCNCGRAFNGGVCPHTEEE